MILKGKFKLDRAVIVTKSFSSVTDLGPPVEKQPSKTGPMKGVPKYFLGAPRSVGRLRQLKYDPIGELVANYRRIEKELEYQEKLRSGEIVELSATGRPRQYRAEVHHALYDKLISIGEKLLRYNYGRVPEGDDSGNKPVSPLVVNLTKKGETYVVNEDLGVNDAEDELSDAHE